MIGDGVNNRATKDTSRPLERLALTVVISGPRSFWPSAVNPGPPRGPPGSFSVLPQFWRSPFLALLGPGQFVCPTVVYVSSFRASCGAVALILFAIWTLSSFCPFSFWMALVILPPLLFVAMLFHHAFWMHKNIHPLSDIRTDLLRSTSAQFWHPLK